ncbi:hypothetical protein NHF46_19145 [Arthrobacter alpinus]|nr:hypothetical protein [Arthrobacter alpinus]
MEYVVPLLIVLAIVIAVVVGSRFVGRRNQPPHVTGGETEASTAPKAAANKRSRHEITREDAQEASARLSPEEHRSVYALIARHQVFNAVKEYRKATLLGLSDAAQAVAALAQFPQPTPERPAAATAVEHPNSEPAAQPEPSIVEGPLTVEDIINAGPATQATPASSSPELKPESRVKPVAAAGSYRYRAIVSQGDEVREVVSTRLNAEIYAQIRQLALSGNYDGAARLLRDHADIGVADAQEFISMIGPED